MFKFYHMKPVCYYRYMPQYIFYEEFYPNYLSGTGYLMSQDVVAKLFKTTLHTPIVHLEDVYITGNKKAK